MNSPIRLASAAGGVVLSLLVSSMAFAQTPTAKVLHEFGRADKASPSSNLIQLPDGDFLGMTSAPTNASSDVGFIYLFKANGLVIPLYAFPADGSQCASGAPNLNSTPGSLMQASDGNFYGVCFAGGQYGMGTVFRFTRSGKFTLLHSFNGSDGINPVGALVEGWDGNLYGVTNNGGLDYSFGGTIFRVSMAGDFTTVWLFNAQTGASNPNAGLAFGPGGNLYGMYQFYQIYNLFGAPGGIYEIDSSGNVTFPSFFESVPWSCAPVVGPKGTIFSLTQAAVFVGNGNQTLEGISSGSAYANIVLNLPQYYGTDYVNFFGCMTLGTDGLLYANGISAIESPAYPYVELQMDLATQQTNFFNLSGYGASPVLSPLEGSDGKLYIVNSGGGTNGLGNILTLDYGIAPPAPRIAAIQPTSGSVGTIVTIGGAFFVGVESVTLNGQAVPFRTAASSYIDFVVPTGATSGAIIVTTAAGAATGGTFTVQ